MQSLKGQSGLKQAFSRMLAGGTVSHAVLIAGPDGSGKRTWGRALAQALLCSERQEQAEPCRRCLSCRQFQSENHPSFVYLEPDGRNLKIDQIRAIRGSLYLKGDSRVCLINQAERMTAEACSSLLKILEEPPPGLYFILLSAQPARLFTTILSRCQRFTLQRLSESEITDILNERTALHSVESVLVSRLSGGLPGAALGLAADEALEQRHADAVQLVRDLSSGRAGSPHALISRAAVLAEREDLIDFLALVHLNFRDVLIWSLCRKEELMINPESAALWGDLCFTRGLEDAVELINQTIMDLLTTNINRRLALEGLLFMLQRRMS
ncbi:MAG: DNA polymerase III subunit delta' [Bacillota bacterium]